MYYLICISFWEKNNIMRTIRFGSDLKVFPHAAEEAGSVEYKFDGHYFAEVVEAIPHDASETLPIDRAEVRDAAELVLLKHEDKLTQIGILACGALAYINASNALCIEQDISTTDGLLEYAKNQSNL